VSRTLLALTGVATALLVSGCAGHPQPAPARVPAADPAPVSTTKVIATPDPTPDEEPAAEPVDPLDEIAFAPDPLGTSPQIALRFLKALQRGDDLAADRELGLSARFELSRSGIGYLHRVMSDVRGHAGLSQAGPCTRARVLAEESVVAFCGQQRVVVHVWHDVFGRTVEIGGWWVHDDAFRGRHTHAFTQLPLDVRPQDW